MYIKLPYYGAKYTFEGSFEHAVDGRVSDARTAFSLSHDQNFLTIEFCCLDNMFTEQNHFHEHNAPLYNQEVFEVFIGMGEEDSSTYMELEINPNNAMWLGKIGNDTLGNGPLTLLKQWTPAEAGIRHEVVLNSQAWAGKLVIPWEFIGRDPQGKYRINFYRIRSRRSHHEHDWVCDPETCDFLCWKSTHSGAEPAFHRPLYFGHLQVFNEVKS